MAGTFTTTSTPAVVTTTTVRQSFTNTGDYPVKLTWTGGRAIELLPGSGTDPRSTATVVPTGSVSASSSSDSTLVVADVFTDAGLPGASSVATDDLAPATVQTVLDAGSATTITSAGTVAITDATLTADCTLTFPTATSGRTFTLLLRQDGTGGWVVTWPATVLWAGGTAPTVTVTASAVDLFYFQCVAGVWSCVQSAQNIKTA